MKRIAIAAMVALVMVTLFPPADFVIAESKAYSVGDFYSSPHRPERRFSRNFTFIAKIGGAVEIRYTQWFAQMGACIAIAGIALALSRHGPAHVPPSEDKTGKA